VPGIALRPDGVVGSSAQDRRVSRVRLQSPDIAAVDARTNATCAYGEMYKMTGDASALTRGEDGIEHRIRLMDGRVLACLELGDAQGVPVFYCHGFPGSRFEARLASGSARRHGIRVLAPDRPGLGASTYLTGRTIGDWAADVAELADRMALKRFALLGVSGGGPYALACAARILQRVRAVAVVAGMAPTRAIGRHTRGMLVRNRLALMLAARAPWLAQGAVAAAAAVVRRHPQRYLQSMGAGAPPADREVLADAAYRALIGESTAEALRQGGRGAAWELTLLARPWDFELQDVCVPVCIWQGSADNIVPPCMARDLATALPNACVHFVDGEGHLSLIVHHLDAALGALAASVG